VAYAIFIEAATSLAGNSLIKIVLSAGSRKLETENGITLARGSFV
jgi:hypothetical protein